MKSFRIKIFLAFYTSLVIILFAFQYTSASSYSLGIYPPIIKIKANPPAIIKSEIKIKNLSGNPVDVGFVLRPFATDENNMNQVKYLLYKDYTTLNTNFLQKVKVLENDQSISKTILSPKQEKRLMLLIDLPKEEKPTDHYFSLVLLTQNQDKLNSSYSKIIEGIATNILISINPKDYKAEIQDFSTSRFFSEGPVKFNVKVKNMGDHFITTSGYILIKNIFGKTVGRVDLNPTNILAKSTAIMFSKENDDIIWPEIFLLGSYTAKLYLTYDNSYSLSGETKFVAIPIKTITLLTIALFIAIYIIRQLKNR